MTITKDIHTDEQKQIIYNNHKNLSLSLRRSFNAFSEEIIDPVKYISNEIMNHAKNGGELPQGVYIFRNKQEALNTTNKSGYALVEVNPQDDRTGVPASEYIKSKGFYCKVVFQRKEEQGGYIVSCKYEKYIVELVVSGKGIYTKQEKVE